jgi:hypothetical protein
MRPLMNSSSPGPARWRGWGLGGCVGGGWAGLSSEWGFWDDQINELLTGIGELLSGGGVPQQPAAPAAGRSPAAGPGETDPAGFTGRGAGEAHSADASLQRTKPARTPLIGRSPSVRG